MSIVVVSRATQLRKLAAFQKALRQLCPLAVGELTFVQQSHNATIFRGTLDGRDAFFKAYDTDDGAALTQASATEIEAASRRMTGHRGGIAPLLWASVPDGMIATGAVPGVAFQPSLNGPDYGRMLAAVEGWLRAYAGDTAFEDRFSTSYWMRKRQAADLSHMAPMDRKIAGDLRDVQAMRAQALGTVAALKGHVPRDFAPWNLHWTGDTVWGFDIEGHKVASLEQTMARFRVLLVELLPTTMDDEQPGPAAQFGGVGSPDLTAFVFGDLLFERFLKWWDHSPKGPRLRRAIEGHLRDS